jgi:hypothetical protein
MILQTVLQRAADTSPIQMGGAFGFGLLIGWYVYYINRYRTGEVQFSDLVTVIGVIGGAGILALFKPESDLFGAYGIGLATGFFLYFFVLMGLVAKSHNFDADWFLDGRRRDPVNGISIPVSARQTTGGAMGHEVHGRG